MKKKEKPASALQAAQVGRSYLHFDAPLSKASCEKLVADPSAVSSHSFLPFLRQDIVRVRIKRAAGKKLEKSKKIRDIRYAAHADSAIYAYYNFLLTEEYERIVKAAGLTEEIIAFRSLGKSNVDFAQHAFQWIEENQPCVALCFDVEDFFGSLDHSSLKQGWAQLLNLSSLPLDHHAVFKSLTAHASVNLGDARKALSLSRTSLRRPKKGKKRVLKRLCNPADFRARIRGNGLIDVNRTKRGIPQGSPMSALLSNVYMLPFDRKMRDQAACAGGYYRRYCDDILLVVPHDKVAEFKEAAESELTALNLKLQTAKTLECAFPSIAGKPLQYLGLIYDGTQVTLRPAGMARFYAKMRRGVRSLKASDKCDGETPIFKQRRKTLIQRYTQHTKPDEGNYFTYVKIAVNRTKSSAIRRQLRRHGKRFSLLIND